MTTVAAVMPAMMPPAIIVAIVVAPVLRVVLILPLPRTSGRGSERQRTKQQDAPYQDRNQCLHFKSPSKVSESPRSQWATLMPTKKRLIER